MTELLGKARPGGRGTSPGAAGGPTPEAGAPIRPRESGGLSRDLRRAGLLSGLGVVAFLDLLALDDLTTSVQPDHLAEIVFLLASIPALVVLFTLWRRTARPGGDDDRRDADRR